MWKLWTRQPVQGSLSAQVGNQNRALLSFQAPAALRVMHSKSVGRAGRCMLSVFLKACSSQIQVEVLLQVPG